MSNGKIGTVNLDWGIQVESPNYLNNVAAIPIPLGTPKYQDVGRNYDTLTITCTVTKDILDDLIEQFHGCPMVRIDVNDGVTNTYGAIFNTMTSPRTSLFPSCYDVTFSGYKLDFDVDNKYYDMFNGVYSLAGSSQVITSETPIQVDDYEVSAYLKSWGDVTFWIQYSPDKATWTTYPDSDGYELDVLERRVDLTGLTGYLRIIASNNESSAVDISGKIFLAKQI
jgi:hypothetical protein